VVPLVNGNKVHEFKKNKVQRFQIYTPLEKKMKMNEKQQCYGLMKNELI
jgi:hypothetical protein